MKYEDLRILNELREKGSITEEEYQTEKAKILNENSSSFNSMKKPLFGMLENTYIMLMHLSQFAGVLIPLTGFIVPILMWIANKDNNLNVDIQGKNILNFMISFAIYGVASAITIIGIPIAVIVCILYIIFVIIATVKANDGEYWKYPLTIQFIK